MAAASWAGTRRLSGSARKSRSTREVELREDDGAVQAGVVLGHRAVDEARVAEERALLLAAARVGDEEVATAAAAR